MEFSYQISEKDYVSAYKLAAKSRRPTIIKVLLFWAFVVICLVIVFGVITKQNRMSEDSEPDAVPVTHQPPVAPALIQNVGPLAAVIIVWIGIIVFVPSQVARRLYRKDANFHGILSVTLNAESFALQSTVGSCIQSRWNVFTGWQERQGILLLRYPNGTFQILNVAGLSETDREQLRRILLTALPEKK